MEVKREYYTTEISGLEFLVRIKTTSGERGGFVAFVSAEEFGYVDMPFRVMSTPNAALEHAKRQLDKQFA